MVYSHRILRGYVDDADLDKCVPFLSTSVRDSASRRRTRNLIASSLISSANSYLSRFCVIIECEPCLALASRSHSSRSNRSSSLTSPPSLAFPFALLRRRPSSFLRSLPRRSYQGASRQSPRRHLSTSSEVLADKLSTLLSSLFDASSPSLPPGVLRSRPPSMPTSPQLLLRAMTCTLTTSTHTILPLSHLVPISSSLSHRTKQTRRTFSLSFSRILSPGFRDLIPRFHFQVLFGSRIIHLMLFSFLLASQRVSLLESESSTPADVSLFSPNHHQPSISPSSFRSPSPEEYRLLTRRCSRSRQRNPSVSESEIGKARRKVGGRQEVGERGKNERGTNEADESGRILGLGTTVESEEEV